MEAAQILRLVHEVKAGIQADGAIGLLAQPEGLLRKPRKRPGSAGSGTWRAMSAAVMAESGLNVMSW
jgi:hypothetical protein